MKLIRSFLFLILLLILGFACFAGAIPLDQENFISERFFAGLEACKGNKVTPVGDVRGGIVPHHMLVGDVIADFYQKLSLTSKPKTIILIGPNHRNLGSAPVLSSLADWDTPNGICQSDKKIIRRLISEGGLSLDDKTLSKEHSVSIQVPFVKKYFPDSLVVPIIVSSSLSRYRSLELGNILNRCLGPGTLVVASIDFSHYLSSQQAEQKDRKTMAAIEDWNYPTIFQYGNDHIDSANVLLAFLKIMASEKANIIEVLQHTNSGIMFGQEVGGSTSYFSLLFSKPQPDDLIRISLCGDIMLAREIGLSMARRGPVYPFIEAKYMFQHSQLVFGNLESILSDNPFEFRTDLKFKAAESSLKGLHYSGINYLGTVNNHSYDFGRKVWDESNSLINRSGITAVSGEAVVFKRGGTKIALLAFDFTRRRFNEKVVMAKVSSARRKADIVIVAAHWGIEYKSKSSAAQQNIAHKMIEAGAQVVVGHHPHVIQEIERYNGGLIFYSLGNFIFDQFQSDDVKQGLVLNVFCKRGKISFVDIVPIKTFNNQARLAEPYLRKPILAALAERSDKALARQIIGGRVIYDD